MNTKEVVIMKDENETKEQLISELEKAKERLRTIFESVSDGVAVTDMELRITDINETGLRMFGYNHKDEIIGRSGLELISPKDQARAMVDMRRTLEKGHSRTLEYTFLAKDGKEFLAEYTVTVIKDESGSPAGFVATMKDVTERKRAENELRKFKTISDKGGYGITIVDLEGNNNYINPSFASMHGFTPDELIGKHFSMHHTEQQMAHVNRLVERLNREGTYVAEEVWHKRKDGTEFPTLMTGTLIRDENGAPIFMAGTAIDITDRKEAEDALRESEEKYRILHDTMAQGVIYQDKTGKVFSMNPAAERILGVPLEQIADVATINKNLRTIREDGSEYKAEDHPTMVSLRTGKPVKNAIMGVYHPEENDYWWININTIPQYKAGEEKPYQVFVTITDITDSKKAEQALKKSEELFRIASQTASDVVYERDLQTGIATFYGDIDSHLGYEPGGYPRTMEGWREHVHPEDLAWFDRQSIDQMEPDVPLSIEYRMRKKDGTFMTWLDRTTMIRDEKTGKPLKFIGAATDITERKRAEEEIQLQTEILRNMTEGVLLTRSRDRKMIYANPRFEKMFGYGPGELIGNNVNILNAPGERTPEEVRVEICKQLDENGVWFGEVHNIKKDGTRFWCRASISEFKHIMYGEVDINVLEDITERKQAEKALRESERKYRELADSLPETVVEINALGNLVFANRNAYKVFGYIPQELDKGLDIYQMIAPQDRDRARENTERRLRGEELGGVEYTALRKDGRSFPVIVYASPVIQEGKCAGLSFVVIDLTEQKRLEEEERKIEKLQSIGTLAGGIAHDFNNLLTGIMGNISLAKRHIEPRGKAFERLEEAEKVSVRARDLTQQLLTFARGGAPVKSTISMSKLIEESATFALHGSKARPVFSIPEDLWTVEADEGQINQVIHNLVKNADEAMPEGGVVEINAKNITIKNKSTLPLSKGRYVAITITDSGIGIKKEHLTSIFDPYFTTKQKGSGLGLATSYSIIKNHGGHIDVDSTDGVGTIFYIYLPASIKKVSQKKEEAVQPTFIGQGRILIMDDEEVVRELLYAELTEAGYEVELTSDGAEAIKRYSEARESGESFDAVIMDLTIPGGMGGKEAIKKLLEIDPDIKAIVSSGYATDPIMSDYEEYGFKAVIAKPYSVSKLEKTLHGLLGQK
jgi:PAS domain S-box-containing protein